jgi:TonB family protein
MLAIALALMAHASARHPRVVVQRPVNPEPLGPTIGWFGPKDYPQVAVITRKEGVTNFELAIDENGLPTDCKITKSSGTPSLDDRTCTIMLSRARFRPAHNKQGTAIPTVFRQSLRWNLPGKKQDQIVDRSFDAKAMIAPTGEVLTCTMTGAGAAKAGAAAAGSGCGPFGDKEFLRSIVGADYAKTRAANVRLTISFAAPPPFDRKPNFQKELAKATIEVSPAGDMASCASISRLVMLDRSVDLCDFIRAAPPHFAPAPETRKATLMMEIGAFFAN